MALPLLISPRVFPILGCIGTLFLVSCSGPRLELLDRPVAESKTTRALTDSMALDRGARDTLREEDLLNLYKRDSAEAIRALATRHQQQPTTARRQALAEMSSDRADRLTAEQPIAALGHYLDAAALTEQAALAAAGQPGESADRVIYDHSAQRIARLLREQPRRGATPITAPGNVRTWRLSLASGPGKVDPRDYDLIVPAGWLKAEGIKWTPVKQAGFGAAMVGHLKATPERKAADPMIPSSGWGVPLNASLRFSDRSATLVLQDLMRDSDASIAGRPVPLAADFSAALAFHYYERTEKLSKLAAMFRPAQHEDTIRTSSIGPFEEDKIPLVLVHGLMSTAESWLSFVNLLLADAVVRERYQIILFNYPTGNPIGRNAADLRDGLAEFCDTYDPKRRNPRMRTMVILGHSMGGIISNMQIRDSGDQLYRTVFTKSLEDLDLESEAEAEVRRLAYFKANPDIDRAVLLAAPLRGSAFATNPIGQLGAWLIRLPFDLVDAVLGDIRVIDALTDVGQEASQRPTNSVNGLRPDNPVLGAVLELPVRPGVEIHSIIAQRNPNDPLQESGDGVVPYTSAHLEEAVSEKIIAGANHRSMVVHEETLGEVVRILHLHAGSAQ